MPLPLYKDHATGSIFLSIAAYRDPQLVPTIEDALRKARHPSRLRFGICWQHAETDPPLVFANDARFRVLDVAYRDSRGACWARAEIMKLYRDEDWFLQIDSHCRFAAGWDETLVRVAAETGSAKPIVSTYPAAFTPGPHEILTPAPMQMVFQDFTPEGIPTLRPAAIPANAAAQRSSVRARFAAAGFLFAPGSFVKEIPYDPDLYFIGEEISLTVRAYTHGYDLFHPTETILWHDYLRADAPKHWGDHAADAAAADEDARATVAPTWSILDTASRAKVSSMLLGEPIAPFGLGSARTLKGYESYAGLSFAHRKAHPYSSRGEEPPNPASAQDWPDKIFPWIATLRFTRAQIPGAALNDPLLWSLSILDAQGHEICHRDVSPSEISALTFSPVPAGASAATPSPSDTLALICEFPSDTIPATWTLWPLTRSHQWLPKFGSAFSDADIAILSPDE